MVLASFPLDASVRDGFGSPGHHVQRLRNHSVGNTWITLSSGPRLHRVISINKSVGAAFAYSTKTSKYRSPSNIPVSSSSYFGIHTTAMSVGVYQIHIRIRILWIFVEILHIRVGRRTVQVIIILLDVLPMIALAIGQPERPLLEYRILAVP